MAWRSMASIYAVALLQHGTLGGFRKSKSCQKHLQLFTGLQNYVLMTVRTKKNMKN